MTDNAMIRRKPLEGEMNTIKRFSTATLMATALLSGAAQAVDIRFEGNVLASACEVDTNLANQTVLLGETPRYQLSVPNRGSEWKEFELKVFNCPNQLVKATVTLTGQAAGSDGSLFLNTGDAKNVHVQLAEKDSTDTPLRPDSVLETTIDPASRIGLFELVARMYTQTGSATSGSVSSYVEVSFSYQ